MTLDVATIHNEKRVLLEEQLLLRFTLFGFDQEPPRADLGPLRVMVFEPAEGWQGHTWAHPLPGGLYEVRFPAPGSGPCYLFFACPKSGIGYAELPQLILQTS